jgi:hypothetical protein
MRNAARSACSLPSNGLTAATWLWVPVKAVGLLLGAVHTASDLRDRPQGGLQIRSSRVTPLTYAVSAILLSFGSNGSRPSSQRTLSSTQVAGMSCINPIAPRSEIACSSPAFSICMMALIQGAGTVNERKLPR